MRYFLLFSIWFAQSAFGQAAQDCIFCKIVQGKAEVSAVFRNEKVMAFLDHAPINVGHALVIPVDHYENLNDAPPAIAAEMMTVAQKIGTSFQRAGIKSEAFQLHMNNGQMVQRVRHAHLHVYPRYRGDFPGDSVVRLASQRQQLERAELDATAAKIKRAMELTDVFTEYYEEGLKLDPGTATSAGDPRYNDLFPNTLSTAYREQLRAYYQKYLAKVKAFDRESLSGADQVSYDTLVWDSEIGLANLGFRSDLLPINQFESPIVYMGIWASGVSDQPFKTVRDYENWLKRLDGFVDWCHTAVHRMREGMASGCTLPRPLAEKVIPQLAKLAGGPVEKHDFYAPVKLMPAEISGEARERLTRAYIDTIERKIIPTFATLHAFFVAEYLPACRKSSGISDVPRGREYYDLQVKQYTTLPLTADEVHELGFNEVKRILGEMDKVKQQVGFTGTTREFFDHVRTRKELMPFTDPQQVIDFYKGLHARMEPQLEKLFTLTPKAGFEVRRTEAFREKSAAAQYFPSSLDGSRPGVFYVPIPDVSKYNMVRGEALFLHEAIPGHHYQIALQREDATLPQFRRTASHSAFVEGWALYCESLGRELGLYTDPYQYFGMLGAEMHRAIRLVVDTGIHAKGWTREQAIKYSMENEGDSEAAITAEIERYMAWPGQALSYKVGQLKIKELRARSEKELGRKFDITEFHKEVLECGSVPLKVLEMKIDRWIAANRPK